MIVKKIGRKAAGDSRQSERRYTTALNRYIVRAGAAEAQALTEFSDDEYIRDLAAYAVRHGATELVRAQWAIGLTGEVLEDWQAEVDALLFRAGSPQGVTDHWVLSWHETDEPTDDEVREAVRLFLKCQQLDGCPVVAGIHEDTDNVHVHLCVTRLDCVTGQRVSAGQGWDIDTAHRSKAVIEERFPHWRREDGALYRIVEGRLVDVSSKSDLGPADNPARWKRFATREKTAQPQPGDGKLDQPSRKFESETGLKSLRRVTWEEAVPALLRAQDWREAHHELAMLGIALRKTRTGGVLAFADKTVKLSTCRQTSFDNLEKRWGAYESTSVTPAPWQPRELYAADSQQARYYSQKRAFDTQLAAIVSQSRAIENLCSGNSSSSSSHREQHPSGHSFPTFADWLAGIAPSDLSQLLQPVADVSCIGSSGVGGMSAPVEAPGLIAMKRRGAVVYRRLDDLTRVAISDVGSLVLVHDDHDPEVIRAALLIAAKKWPGAPLDVTGNAAFVRRATAIAAELRIEIAGAPQAIPVSIPSGPKASPRMQAPKSEKLDLRLSSIPASSPAAKSQEVHRQSDEGLREPRLEHYLAWKHLRADREQGLEQERLALLVAQDELAMRTAKAEGHEAKIIEQASVRRAWLAAQAAAAQNRGWGR